MTKSLKKFLITNFEFVSDLRDDVFDPEQIVYGNEKKCSVEWCQHAADHNDMCNLHNQRKRNAIDLNLPYYYTGRNLKRATKCQLCNSNHKVKTGKPQHMLYGTYCSSCIAYTERTKIKKLCVEYFGNKCVVCEKSYNLCVYDFHHLDESGKEHQIAQIMRVFYFDKLVVELEKCILLCANCHRDIHWRKTVRIERGHDRGAYEGSKEG